MLGVSDRQAGPIPLHISRERKEINRIISKQLDYVPASLRVLQYQRVVSACDHCEENVAAARKLALPIDKGLAEPGLIVCMAHCRRYFYDAIGIDSKRSHHALSLDSLNPTLPGSTRQQWLPSAATAASVQVKPANTFG